MKINCLVEIPVEDWHKLRDLYVNHKLESNSFNTIQNYINWLNIDSSLKDSVKLYSLNGDWSDGTFIIIDHTFYVMLNTLENSERQQRLLAALHCLNRKGSFQFCTCVERISNTIRTYLSELGISKDHYQFSPTCIWYHLELKKALQFDITPSNDITLSALRIEDIETINNMWPIRHPGSESFIGRLVKFNQNIGVYEKKSGKLIAWCLFYQMGSLGLLNVQDGYKRKGFGSLMVRVMAKMLAEKGIETLVPVVEENSASRAMFKALGFLEISKAYWFQKPALE